MEENVHTVKILDLIISDDMVNIFIVMNFIESDLKKLMSRLTTKEEHIITILYKFLCALNFIH